MGQQDTYGTASTNLVNDTIAFGSMLVFASVMPSLGSEVVDPDVQGACKRTAVPDGIEPVSAKKPARSRGGTSIRGR